MSNSANWLRTPDERFLELPDFAFKSNYMELRDSELGPFRVHYLDEGPQQGPVVLLLHGEPTWSYLYRHVIPHLVAAGARCIAPDLPGFGRSDKPARRGDCTYGRHVSWMRDCVAALQLREITLFGQDWGGLIGLRLLAEAPDLFARAAIANTGLPTGDSPMGPAFAAWREFSQSVPELPVGGIVKGGCLRDLSAAEVAAYEAPFPDETYKEAARQFPLLVPTDPRDPAAEANRRAWTVLESWTKPFLCCFSDSDPITQGADRRFRERVPGTKGQPHTTIPRAGHFVQEDAPETLARILADFLHK